MILWLPGQHVLVGIVFAKDYPIHGLQLLEGLALDLAPLGQRVLLLAIVSGVLSLDHRLASTNCNFSGRPRVWMID